MVWVNGQWSLSCKTVDFCGLSSRLSTEDKTELPRIDPGSLRPCKRRKHVSYRLHSTSTVLLAAAGRSGGCWWRGGRERHATHPLAAEKVDWAAGIVHRQFVIFNMCWICSRCRSIDLTHHHSYHVDINHVRIALLEQVVLRVRGNGRAHREPLQLLDGLHQRLALVLALGARLDE